MKRRDGGSARGRRGALCMTCCPPLIGFCLLLACYNPKVLSGGYACGQGPRPCPDGFACVGAVCVQGDGAGGAGGSAAGGTSGSGAGGATGSGGSRAPRSLGQTCSITVVPGAAQTDDCDGGAGLVCVTDCGGSSSRCYQVCQSDPDCPASACSSRTSAAGDRLCEVPFTTCDPVSGQTGCGAGAGCFLLSPSPAPSGADRLVCDCVMGGAGANEPCSDSRDCFRGLVCPPAGSAFGANICQHVCDPQLGSADCSIGTSCRLFGDRWGFCF